MLALSIVNSAYEINDIIPNIELLLFKMFCSPISTKAERKEQDFDDLLVGNLFRGVELDPLVYQSLF